MPFKFKFKGPGVDSGRGSGVEKLRIRGAMVEIGLSGGCPNMLLGDLGLLILEETLGFNLMLLVRVDESGGA